VGRRDIATQQDMEKEGNMKENMQLQTWMDTNQMDINQMDTNPTEMGIRVMELDTRVTENVSSIELDTPVLLNNPVNTSRIG
jgi:hypothetical protein